MGQSTNGQICYGMAIDEDSPLPWRDEDDGGDNDIDDWWRKENGYEEPFQLFDQNGNWLNGVEAPESLRDQYFNHRNDWDAEHPLPLALVNTCSGDYPLWILAVPGTVSFASRGNPLQFSPSDLVVLPDQEEALRDFCAKYEIEGGQFGWYLSSYWG